jgi:ribonucleoside-diphosphate reductase alpha chain
VFIGIKTTELDDLIAETSAYLNISHPDFGKVAARVAVTKLHKETHEQFKDVISDLYLYEDKITGANASLIHKRVYDIVMANHEVLQAAINYKKDWEYDFFGYKTLERSYLLKVHGKVVERPQHMIMRVALGIHMEDINAVIETYNLMSDKWFTHATPTLFNAGTPNP